MYYFSTALTYGREDPVGEHHTPQIPVDRVRRDQGAHREEESPHEDGRPHPDGGDEGAGEGEDDALGDAPRGLDGDEVAVGQVAGGGRVAAHVRHHVRHHVGETRKKKRDFY